LKEVRNYQNFSLNLITGDGVGVYCYSAETQTGVVLVEKLLHIEGNEAS
jgi:hypothetical protein